MASMPRLGIVTTFLILLFTIRGPVWGQSFTRITTGAIVNDGGVAWGCSWADFNGDGFLDLLVTNTGQAFLYVGTGDTVFTRIDTGAVVTDSLEKRGSTWGDFDDDGDLDLFIANANGQNYLFRNNGNGFLDRITSGVVGTDEGTGRGCAWVDYDLDGWLDLFVTTTTTNRLYHNDGNDTFTLIGDGPIVTDVAQSIECSWGDYDNDGYPDVFVSNISVNNALYRNNTDGTFTKVTTGAIVNDGGISSGAAWGDYDNDGDLDLFVSNLINENNFFYHNDGPPDYTFTKDASSILVNDGGLSYVSSWVDYDNDGDLDLFVFNRGGQQAFQYVNGGPPDYTFTGIDTGVVVTDGGDRYGSAWADFDRDGDLDLFVCNHGGNNSLYRNNATGNNWIEVRCIGVAANSSSIGVRVRIKASIGGSPRWQMQEISSQTGYYSQNCLDAHFGLGDATIIDSLVIDWRTPAGNVEVYTDVPVNQLATFTQGPTAVGEDPPPIPHGFYLSQNYPNPFNPTTTIQFSIPQTSFVNLAVFNILGEKVATLVSGQMERGIHTVQWDAAGHPGGMSAEGRPLDSSSGYASGVYFCRISHSGGMQSIKMLLTK